MKETAMVILCLACGLTSAQTLVTGKVTDSKGKPVALANVFISGTYDGSTTDSEGLFSFTTLERDSAILTVTFVGYREFNKPVSLESSSVVLSAVLEEMVNELDAVTISAGSFTASDESRRTIFRAVDIATTAGATADIAGAMNTLPGTQKVGESGRLFVRGGDGNEARTFIDGMMVLDPYGAAAPNTPSRGRFLPFMFKGMSFSTGGYSAEYGQALSSALVLDSKDKADGTRTDIGLLSVGGDVVHTQAWKKGSAAAKVEFTDLRPYFDLVRQDIDWKSAPSSAEASAVFRHQAGGSMLKFFGHANSTQFSLYQHDIDDSRNRLLTAIQNDYLYLNGAWRNAIGKRWVARGGGSLTSVSSEVNAGDSRTREHESGVHVKGVAEGSLTGNVDLKVGGEILTHRFERSSVGIARAFDQVIGATFAEADIYAGNQFIARGGVRVEYNSLGRMLSSDPRISLARKTGANGQLSLAAGIFRQAANREHLLRRLDLTSERASHFILNYQYLDDRRIFRAEAYHKAYADLVKFSGDRVTNNGRGFARGFELFWRDSKSLKNLDYWLSYSLLDTRRDYLHFPRAATPSFASRHNFSAVAKYFITTLRSQPGATWSFASGRPYHDPNGQGFNTGRTPNYSDVSFNWSYLPAPHVIVYWSCTNVTGRENIFSYEYSDQLNENGTYNGRAIRQPAPRFFFLGVFITVSRDKTVNQLPSL